MELYQELEALIDALSLSRIPHAICGGIAVVMHGHPRLTKDIDLLVRPEAVEKIRDAVGPLGYTVDAGAIPFDVGTPRERTVHRLSKVVGDDLLTLDLIVVSPPLEKAWATRQDFKWKDRVLTIVSREGLAILKRLAGRTQDLADLENLGLDQDKSDD